MYQESKRTCRTIVLLIKPFVWWRSRWRRLRGLLKLPNAFRLGTHFWCQAPGRLASLADSSLEPFLLPARRLCSWIYPLFWFTMIWYGAFILSKFNMSNRESTLQNERHSSNSVNNLFYIECQFLVADMLIRSDTFQIDSIPSKSSSFLLNRTN